MKTNDFDEYLKMVKLLAVGDKYSISLYDYRHILIKETFGKELEGLDLYVVIDDEFVSGIEKNLSEIDRVYNDKR